MKIPISMVVFVSLFFSNGCKEREGKFNDPFLVRINKLYGGGTGFKEVISDPNVPEIWEFLPVKNGAKRIELTASVSRETGRRTLSLAVSGRSERGLPVYGNPSIKMVIPESEIDAILSSIDIKILNRLFDTAATNGWKEMTNGSNHKFSEILVPFTQENQIP